MKPRPRMIRFESGSLDLNDVLQVFKDPQGAVRVTYKDESVVWFAGIEAEQVWCQSAEFWEPREQ